MRTSRLTRRWFGGALVAAGVVTAFGGQTVGNDAGVQALSPESAQTDVATTTDTAAGDGIATTDSFEWT